MYNFSKVICFGIISFGVVCHSFRVMMSSTQPTYQTTAMINENSMSSITKKLKFDILQLGAALDRGQAYNPTSGEYYKERASTAKEKIKELISQPSNIPATLAEMEGEWELVLTTVPHGIFRSSPFFLAIQEAYARVGCRQFS
jgi:hypothetical protein